MGIDQAKKCVLLSVKTAYAELLVEGAKRIELRRRFPIDLSPGTKIVVYASGEAKRIIGEVLISRITRLSISELWKFAAIDAMISWPNFEKYFAGTEYGYAIEVERPQRYRKSISLSQFYAQDSGVRPPQSYCYLPNSYL